MNFLTRKRANVQEIEAFPQGMTDRYNDRFSEAMLLNVIDI